MTNVTQNTKPGDDNAAREKLTMARVGLLFNHGFFGNMATNLKLINADQWCPTAATDGRNFYYNSNFINSLERGEVEFLFGHEVLHIVYDHLGRKDDRDMQIWNIANDYAVNADLRKHKVGQFITTVPCLYEEKYAGKPSEEIYDDLIKNAKKIDLESLTDMLLDQHMSDSNSESDNESQGGNKPAPLNSEEREKLRQEIKQQVLAAAASDNTGNLPANVSRIINQITEPKMPWRELLSANLTSAIRSDYSFSKINRRSWHMEAILPGLQPDEEIDICIAVDMSGSINTSQATDFLSEINGIMQSFNGFKLHVFCFDTDVYNPCDFTSDNLDTIADYELRGGGGTKFEAIFNYLKTRGQETKRLVVFTDGYPYGSWGDPDFCDTTWIIHGDPNPNPPFGSWAIYQEYHGN